MPRAVFSESLPLADLLVRSAEIHPDHVALVFPDCEFTYQQLLEGAVRTAQGLHALGIQAGDRVGLLMPNSPEFVDGFFGAALLGAVLVPLNVRYRSAELAYIIDHAQLSAVLTTDRIADRTDFRVPLAEAFPELAASVPGESLKLAGATHLRHMIMLRGGAGLGFIGEEQFGAGAESVDHGLIHSLRSLVRVQDVALIIYTSGTTARPKGCMLTNEAVTRGPVGRAAERIFDELPGERVVWCPLPLFHIAAIQGFLSCVGEGATFVTDVFLDPARALELIKRQKATSLWPLFMNAWRPITGVPGFDPSDLQHVRTIVTVGTPVDLLHIQDVFPWATLVNGSGMSEMTGHFCLSTREDSRELRATTSGQPVAGAQVRIIAPETGDDEHGERPGELLVRGYGRMTGYYRDPERTAAAIDADGWLHTGDLFRRLASGHFVYEGRLKDMLKVGGENVSAVEVEALICGHPGVASAEVVGRPDERLDEVPVAFVELKEGSGVTGDELIAYCVGKIASFKVPRAVFFVAPGQWPMSATKVSKIELRKRALESIE
jgi:acyl-CoA synthetase (AMP-forming)/AMP-acid ligase II